MDQQEQRDEIVQHLLLLDRRLNYFIGIVLVAIGIEIAAVTFLLLKRMAAPYIAFIVAMLVAWAIPRLLKAWFGSEESSPPTNSR
jgi:hypothetical protein